MYDEYRISEEDIQAIIRNLKITDPRNANRDYAVQLVESMQEFGSELARTNESLAEAVKKKLDEKKRKTKGDRA